MSITASRPARRETGFAVLAQARLETPECFATVRDPKILALPGPAWINRSVEVLVVVEGVAQLAA
ncbi:hypothetical protein [Demequina lutea]|uniref:Uncharacterized protein n=1 Tax=Demequina lutea TaxID=431489 RepID=A0A7Z0CGE6_9MICO|nr:hypothetical protein [Demequina lutea]